MKWYFVIALTLTFLDKFQARPSDGVEIEKLRLVKFPEEIFQYQTSEQSDETRRILEEIEKINQAFGYTTKRDEIHQNAPTILDSETYLFPGQTHHPIHSVYNHGMSIPSSIRKLHDESDMNHESQEHEESKEDEHQDQAISRKIVHQHSVMIPQQDTYYYPAPYLRLPFRDSPRNFKSTDEEANESFESVLPAPQKLMAISNDVTSIVEYARDFDYAGGEARNKEEFENRLLNDVKKIVDDARRKKAKTKHDHKNRIIETRPKTSQNVKLLLVPGKLHHGSNIQTQNLGQIQINKPLTQDKQRPNTKIKKVAQKGESQSPNLQKTTFGIFNKPIAFARPQQTVTTTEDYYSDTSSDEEKPHEKHILLAHRKEGTAVQKDALKDGGIIIQKLRVRKGGIAIAGPGGVATAGSGGTAIVGPGGLALTHPKSLTIAGPGARIVSLPESYDLDKAILKSSARNLPLEGKLVATGPTIYYNAEYI